MDESQTALIDIAEDVRMEILRRVDANSICRLRCVSKPWNSLLRSTSFIAGWRNSGTGENEKTYLLTNPDSKCGIQSCKFTDGMKSYPPASVDDHERSKYGECVCYDDVGLVHGVLCRSSPRHFVVWNPAVQRCMSFIFNRRYEKRYQDGFGFDASNNEFKVVAFSNWGAVYDVISVQDGQWRQGRFPASIQGEIVSNSCYWNGDIYWIIVRGESKSLLLFNCMSEEWKTREIKLDGIEKRQPFLYNGLLTVVRRVQGVCELWGVKERDEWSKIMGDIEICRQESDAFYVSRGKGQPIGSLLYEESLFLIDDRDKGNQHSFASLLCCRCYSTSGNLYSLTCHTPHYSQCRICL